MKAQNVLVSIFWMTSAVCSSQTLNILTYDYANLTSEQTESMQKIAGFVFKKTGITLSWEACRGATATPESSGRCQRELGSHDVVVRLRQSEQPSARSNAVTLAYAVVAPDGGKFASLLYEAVKLEAKGLHLSSTTLLGYAAAHEIGHCLLGPGHSPASVMQAAWTPRVARDMDQMRLAFSHSEAQKLVARLR